MRRIGWVCLAVLWVAGGCDRAPAGEQPQTNLPRGMAVVAGKTFSVQICATPEQQRKGYMFTPRIPDGEGMVFVFPQPGRQAFWNHNVPIPLDVVYVRPDLSVDSIVTMPARSTRNYPSATGQVQYVLEFNAGTAAALGLRVGDRVSLSPEVLHAGRATP